MTRKSRGSDGLTSGVTHTDHRTLFMIQNCGTQGHTRMHTESKAQLMWVMYVLNETQNDSDTQNSEDSDGNMLGKHSTCGYSGTSIQHNVDAKGHT